MTKNGVQKNHHAAAPLGDFWHFSNCFQKWYNGSGYSDNSQTHPEIGASNSTCDIEENKCNILSSK